MDKNDYYSHPEVLYEMTKCMQGRECAFLSKNMAIRCIKAHSPSYLIKNMDAFRFKDSEYNIYRSLAYMVNMPVFTFHLEKRIEQQQAFKDSFEDYLKGYDFAFDFDSEDKNWIKPYKDCTVLKNLFDQYGVPYILKFSGSGFHMVISHHYIPSVMNKPNERNRDVAERLKMVFNLETLDMNIYDIRRLWKTEYSYDVKTGNIALPLNDSQFDNFSIDIVKPENVIKYGVKNRGTLERRGSQLNVAEMLADLMED